MDTSGNPMLSGAEVDAINAAVGLPPTAERRRHTRHTLPLGFWLSVRVRGGEGGSEVFRATGRDLSASGIGFHHTAPVAEHSICDMEFRTLAGETVTVPGAVVRCRRVTGSVHDIAVEFHFEIDPSEFCSTATPTATHAAEGALESAGTLASRLVGELATMVDRREDWKRLSAKVREIQNAMGTTATPPPGAPTSAKPRKKRS